MTPAEELRAVLTGHAPLVARVGSRIRSDIAAPGDVLPLIVFQRVSVAPEYNLGNEVVATRSTFQVECWGNTRSESSDVAELVIAALAAADLPIDPSDPDALDPETAQRAVVLNLDIWH